MFQAVEVFLFTIMMSKLFADTKLPSPTKFELKFTENAIGNAKIFSNSFGTMSKPKHVRGGCSPLTGVLELNYYTDSSCLNMMESDGYTLNKCIESSSYPGTGGPEYVINYGNQTSGIYNVGSRTYSDSACTHLVKDYGISHFSASCTAANSLGGNYYYKFSNPTKFRSTFPAPGVKFLGYSGKDCSGCQKASSKSALGYQYFPTGVCDYNSVLKQCSKEKFTYDLYTGAVCTGNVTVVTNTAATISCIKPPSPGYAQSNYVCV